MIFVRMRGYEESVAALGQSEEVHASRRLLMAWLEEYADRGRILAGTSALIVRIPSHPGLAPLRLYYRFEKDTVYLYRLRWWDELRDPPARSS